jgi:hypothetical protein
MIFTFRSNASGDVIMLENNGRLEVRDHVFLYQRAFPILKMLERSLKEDEPVTWTT